MGCTDAYVGQTPKWLGVCPYEDDRPPQTGRKAEVQNYVNANNVPGRCCRTVALFLGRPAVQSETEYQVVF